MATEHQSTVYEYIKMIFTLACVTSGLMGFTHTLLFFMTGRFDDLPRVLDVGFFCVGLIGGIGIALASIIKRSGKGPVDMAGLQ